MALELIVNVLLLLASVFCYFYVGSTMPKSAASELGAEQWPQALLVILILAVCWNLRNYFRRNALVEMADAFRRLVSDFLLFLRSKLFVGMLILMVMAWMYEPVGFLVTSLAFLVAYGILLGERRPAMLLLSSLAITILLYIGFSVFLGVMLPRGSVPVLRNFALFLESIGQGLAG